MSRQDIKRRIHSVNSTKQITRAMQLVSAARMRTAKRLLGNVTPYFKEIVEQMDIIKPYLNSDSIFVKSNKSNKRAFLVISSDRGLAGGYNVNVVKKVFEVIEPDDIVMPVGNKVVGYLNEHGIGIYEKFDDVTEHPEYVDAFDIANTLIDEYKNGKFGMLFIIYTKFINSLKFQVQSLKILPLHGETPEGKVESKIKEKFIIEPSVNEFIESIIVKYVTGIIYGSLINSSASEYSARMTAMSTATDNANSLLKELTQKYNRARQASITQELSEIIGGAEALGGL